ncbi:CYTH domain-containing protein [Atopobacter phocae]|uniref:CYTH domain-containing protein n=1 Tax=Atopobacter phocae TaxID=136492 RepID=UPI00046F9EF7|nr:CYTH domain-containing protein [Atopobacter phocae]
MTKEIEKEIKINLSKENYLTLFKHLNLDQTEPLHLNNVYFDHPQFKSEGLALRLRLIEHQSNNENVQLAEITLKENVSLGQKNEYNVSISWEEAQQILSNQLLTIPKEIKHVLETRHIFETTFARLLSIHTKRYELVNKEGLIVLDEVTFDNQSKDYELEFEVNDLEQGQRYITQFINKLNIPFIPSDNKLARALDKIV